MPWAGRLACTGRYHAQGSVFTRKPPMALVYLRRIEPHNPCLAREQSALPHHISTTPPGAYIPRDPHIEQALFPGLGGVPTVDVDVLQEGDALGTNKRNVLASSKRIHNMLFLTLGATPPPSWKRRLGSAAATALGDDRPDPKRPGSRRGASKQAELGPTDTASLQEMLACSGSGQRLEVGGRVCVRVGS